MPDLSPTTTHTPSSAAPPHQPRGERSLEHTHAHAEDASATRPDPPRRSSSIRFHTMPHPRASGDAPDERTAFASRENSTRGRAYAATTSIVRGRDRDRDRDSAGSGSSTPSESSGRAGERAGDRAGVPPAGGFATWWRDVQEKFGSVELDNKGSVARDHLALERTFLAWLRTSLAFASIGIAVTQLFRLNTSIADDDGPSSHTPSGAELRLRHVGKPLGATFIAVAMVVLFTGYHRYFEGQYYVIRGRFPASRGSVILIAMCAGALIVSSLVVILAFGRGQWEV